MDAFPDLKDITDVDLDLDPSQASDAAAVARARRRDVVRKRMRNTMPPLPELRFEMAFLRSVLPACTPTHSSSAAQDVAEGREVRVDWRRAAWITVKDQVISPLFQGMFWALLSIYGGSVVASMKAGLGFPVAAPKPAPGDVRSRSGETWREFARSKTGAVETVMG